MLTAIMLEKGTLHRASSSSVEGSSLKGTGTATGGHGPAALTTLSQKKRQDSTFLL